MTFSIAARDRETGTFGVATATGSLAVGAQVPHCSFGAGAIITQGHSTNVLIAEDGISLLQRGRSAEEVLRRAVDDDQGRDYRQMAVLDAQGRGACWTGAENGDHKGHDHDEDLILAGNLLAGSAVLDAMAKAYDANGGGLAERLLAALLAGQDAGGDRRGTCSAALLIDEGSGAALDLRVDYAERAVADLMTLYERSKDEDYRAFLKRLPNRENPHRY